MAVVVADGFGLVDGAFRSGYYVLLASTGNYGLDPEVRREIGQVGDYRHEGATGADIVPAFTDFAIEVGDYRDQQVGGIFFPIVFEQMHQRAMENADGALEDSQQSSCAEGPAVLQEHVVLLLDSNAGEFAEDVEFVGQLLELDELDLPRASLLGEDGLESYCSVAVAAPCVMKKDVDFFHEPDCRMAFRHSNGSKLHAMWIRTEVVCAQ